MFVTESGTVNPSLHKVIKRQKAVGLKAITSSSLSSSCPSKLKHSGLRSFRPSMVTYNRAAQLCTENPGWRLTFAACGPSQRGSFSFSHAAFVPGWAGFEGSKCDPRLDKSWRQMAYFLQTTCNSPHLMGFTGSFA